MKQYYLIGLWSIAVAAALFLVLVDEETRAELQSQLHERIFSE